MFGVENLNNSDITLQIDIVYVKIETENFVN